VDKIDSTFLLSLINRSVPFVGQPETVFLFVGYATFKKVWDEILVPSMCAEGTQLMVYFFFIMSITSR